MCWFWNALQHHAMDDSELLYKVSKGIFSFFYFRHSICSCESSLIFSFAAWSCIKQCLTKFLKVPHHYISRLETSTCYGVLVGCQFCECYHHPKSSRKHCCIVLGIVLSLAYPDLFQIRGKIKSNERTCNGSSFSRTYLFLWVIF